MSVLLVTIPCRCWEGGSRKQKKTHTIRLALELKANFSERTTAPGAASSPRRSIYTELALAAAPTFSQLSVGVPIVFAFSAGALS